jgi:hypothetical protein
VIPRTIHQIWLGPKPRPAAMMDSWRENHPDWSYHVWTEENLDYPLHNQAQYDAMKDFGGKADVLRYEILYRHGGIYVDADMTSLLPLDPAFLDHEFFAAYENERLRPGLVANGIIGCAPGHPVVERMIERIHELHPLALGSADASIETGPYAFTDVIESLEGEVRIFPSRLFFPEHYLSAFVSDAESCYARHDWYSGYPTICLTMVIESDTANLWGCLPRIKPHIGCYRIALSDRGAPRSREIIATVLGDLPGEVLEIDGGSPDRAWADVSRAAEGEADYALVADPDTLLYDFRRIMLGHQCDRYRINEHRRAVKRPTLALVRADGSWKSPGSGGEEGALLGCCHFRRLESRPVPPSRRMDEEALLLDELADRPDDPEVVFYLGQYSEDTGDPARAVDYYRNRAAAGGWKEQAWEACLRIARCLRMADEPWPEIERALMDAHRMDPTRAEPLLELGAAARRRGHHDRAAELLLQAAALPEPDVFFYRDAGIRQQVLEQLCVCAYYAGRYAEGLRAGLEALQASSPYMGRHQIIKNIGFYLDKVEIRSLDEE